MQSDWIKLHRKSLDSEVFTDPWLWKLWCWCLMRANWKAKKFQGVELQPGQFATGKNAAAECLNVSPSKFHRGLHKLKDMDQLKVEANNRFTVVTICHWGTYQNSEQVERSADGPPMDRERSADGPPMDPIEEGKNSKEGKNNSPPTANARFDEQIVDEELNAPEFKAAWHRWVGWIDSQSDRPMDFARAERDLMECSRRGVGKAIQDIEFTISKDGNRRILDSDMDFDKRRNSSGRKKRRSYDEVFGGKSS